MGTRRSLSPAQEGSQAPHRTPPVQASGSLTAERYPRYARLTRDADLKACWDAGQRRHTAHLELAWRPNDQGHPRFAFVVPRFQRTAVARNRLRRRLREAVRSTHLQRIPSVDAVVRARRTAYDTPFALLSAELGRLVSHVA